MAVMGLVWVTEWKYADNCPGIDYYKGFLSLKLCLEEENGTPM